MSTHTADNSTAPQTSLGPFSSPGANPTPWEATEWALRRIQNSSCARCAGTAART
ncbi:hypothetical protein GCM10022225_63130 [Plantactinospora mayteni]|uniref:Uncharacterized protein n=1 Tax=Plantactinospora mayteni TaxID=566021 RepID=A0ABQ4F032_9ACTN|nr:hypothetical protein Pma05_68150 [Plantactinospora mayteni]